MRRWAAKEATIKAFGSRRKLTLRQVLVLTGSKGEPFAVVLDESGAKDELRHSESLKNESGSTQCAPMPSVLGAPDRTTSERKAECIDPDLRSDICDNRYSDDESLKSLDGQIARLSISHDGDYATAICLAAIPDC